MYGVFLGEVSEKDRKFDKHKIESLKVCKLFEELDYKKKYDRMINCSTQISMNLSEVEEQSQFKLKLANFCRVRECPMCQWRRSLKWRSRVFRGLPRLFEDYPKNRWLFLTLTMPNIELKSLREGIKQLNDGFVRLTKLKGFPGLGWIKSVEVTRNQITDMAHPHLHILIMVSKSYYSGISYINHAKWVQLWKKCMRFDFEPIVNIKAVKDCKDDFEKLSQSILEITKYQVKPSDLSYSPEWLRELSHQLENTRAISIGGVLKNYFKEVLESDDLININDNEENVGTDNILDVAINFTFDNKHMRYKEYSNV